MVRNTAREIAVHLAYELSFTDKTAEELVAERLSRDGFAELAGEDELYSEAAQRQAGGVYPRARVRRGRSRAGAGRIHRQVRQGLEL